MSTTSVSLLRRIQRLDDDQAWDRFVRLYTPLIFYLARVAGASTEDAVELVQEVFSLLVQKIPQFEYDSQQSFRAWLRTVTLNRCRDWLRRSARSAHAESGSGPAAPLDVDPAELMAEGEYHRYVARRALELMQTEFQPATWRACWMQVVEGRSAAEIAGELGITVNAAYLAKSRVLRRLREELAGLID